MRFGIALAFLSYEPPTGQLLVTTVVSGRFTTPGWGESFTSPVHE